jgi:hypothetical protein
MHPGGMGWSWPDFQATPPYVRQMCWAFLVRQRRAEIARGEKAQRSAQAAQDGKMHIAR